MVFQAAEAMRRADAGDVDAKCLLRILTPLVKFRVCRDARVVTADAMEVRGGCGYIEDWPDARLVRDAHLGSIWEGTSNIVALDVLRSARRERGLLAISAHIRCQLAEAPLHGCEQALQRACELVETAQANEALARTAASALYHLASAAAMSWEAKRIGDTHRAEFARLVMEHRVLPRDPLSATPRERAGISDLLAAHTASAH